MCHPHWLSILANCADSVCIIRVLDPSTESRSSQDGLIEDPHCKVHRGRSQTRWSLDRRVGMLILDVCYRSIIPRRKRGSLAADFSSFDTRRMDVRAVEPAFDLKPQAATEHKCELPDVRVLIKVAGLDPASWSDNGACRRGFLWAWLVWHIAIFSLPWLR